MDSSDICDFCGDFVGTKIHFISSSGTAVCTACVEKFHKTMLDVKASQKKIRENVKVFVTPVEHNFRVIDGGKS